MTLLNIPESLSLDQQDDEKANFLADTALSVEGQQALIYRCGTCGFRYCSFVSIVANETPDQIFARRVDIIRVQRQAKFAQRTILCFQYLGFHDHAFNRAKVANYVISPGFHGQAFHGLAQNLSRPGVHDKQQNSFLCTVIISVHKLLNARTSEHPQHRTLALQHRKQEVPPQVHHVVITVETTYSSIKPGVVPPLETTLKAMYSTFGLPQLPF